MADSFCIVCDKDDLRLDVYLSETLGITRTRLKDMIDNGHVRVDGKPPKPSLKVRKAMKIEGETPEEEPLSLVPENIPLDILYEDGYLLAVNKPADMVVHPSFGHASGTLVNAILGYLGYGGTEDEAPLEQEKEDRPEEADDDEGYALKVSGHRPGIVHRLDKGTTGVILIAKDSKTQELLSGLFKERSVKKTYRAIVEGKPRLDEWAAHGSIGRHPVERKKMAVLKTGGRPSETSFKVLQRLRGFVYLEAYPRTGRTHQIRVHLAHAGYPIVGDETYGRSAKTLALRPLLHACRIEFTHPVTAVPIIINAPVPQDMEDFLATH